MVAVSTCGGAAVCVDGQGLRRATPDGVSGGGSDRCVHGMGHPQGSRGRRRVDQPDSAGGTLAHVQLHSLEKRGWGPVSPGERRFAPLADSPRKPPKVKWRGNKEGETFLG